MVLRWLSGSRQQFMPHGRKQVAQVRIPTCVCLLCALIQEGLHACISVLFNSVYVNFL